MCVIETQVDDIPGEVLGYAMERLLSDGALDAFITHVQMKKNRPGALITVICRPNERNRFMNMLFDETGTLGVRHMMVERTVLNRHHESIILDGQSIRMKIANTPLGIHASPEYEDCKQAAIVLNKPLKNIMHRAQAIWNEGD